MKYVAISLHALAIGVGLWMLVSFLKPKPVVIPQVQSGRAAPVTTSDVLKKDADAALHGLSSLALLNDHVGREGIGRMRDTQTASAALLGLMPVRDLSASALRIMPKRRLTMVLQSRLEPRAMIDGRLVKPGDTLPEDGRVAEINTDRVVLVERYGTQTLTMATSRARLGGSQPLGEK